MDINNNETERKYKRPPFGLTPVWIWLEQRVDDINGAIQRYMDAGMEIDKKWIDERNNLINIIAEYGR